MNSAADALAAIRARLAELESRAAIRRTRDAELAAEPTPAPKAPAKSGRKRTEDEPAMQGRDWLAEAREDLARVDAAPRVQTRRIRPATAPEYASVSDALQREPETNRTEPTTTVGGNVVEAAAGDLEDSQGAAAVPEGGHSSAIGSGVFPTLAGQGAKSPAHIRKLPMASAGDWRERMKRIDENALRASFAPSLPIASPYDLPTPVRDDPRPAAVAGCGPPGGSIALFGRAKHVHCREVKCYA